MGPGREPHAGPTDGARSGSPVPVLRRNNGPALPLPHPVAAVPADWYRQATETGSRRDLSPDPYPGGSGWQIAPARLCVRLVA